MKINFTKKAFSFMLILCLGFLINPIQALSQNCQSPDSLITSNISNFTATANWVSGVNVDHYRLRYKQLGSSIWNFKHNLSSLSYDFDALVKNSQYIWQVKAFCSTGNSFNSSWSVLDTFTTTNYALDCHGDIGGTAFTDICGNCVGGNTGSVSCIPFSPTVSVLLSNTDCDSLTDLTINVSQDPNEPDMLNSSFVSDGGSFAISLMNIGDTVGLAVMTAGGGPTTFNTTLIVDALPSSTQAIIQSIDIVSGFVLGTFTISNSTPGVSITVQSPADNNNVTSGNSQWITFSNVFINPPAGILTFTSTIDSELGDVDVQIFSNTIVCTDCYGDVGGTAFIDSCGNCVGGNTGTRF